MFNSIFGQGNFIHYAGFDEGEIDHSPNALPDTLLYDYYQIVTMLENIQKGVCCDNQENLQQLIIDSKHLLKELRISEIGQEINIVKLQSLILDTERTYQRNLEKSCDVGHDIFASVHDKMKISMIRAGHQWELTEMDLYHGIKIIKDISDRDQLLPNASICNMMPTVAKVMISYQSLMSDGHEQICLKYEQDFLEIQSYINTTFKNKAETEFKSTFENYLKIKGGSLRGRVVAEFATTLAKRILMLYHGAVQFKMPFIEKYQGYVKMIESAEGMEIGDID